ncbi:MAG: ABC transporter substrate-binding protein [Acetivibrionales bacterium]|jgi:putative aldouronate transport system substrate-binding protein
MMKYKKLISVIPAVLIIIILFSLLTKDYDVIQTSGKNDPHKAVVIKWMVFGEKSKNSDDVFAEFNKKLQEYYSDTTVEFEIASIDTYKEKWDMKMATNEVLDLVWIGNDIFNYTEEVKKGSFIALDYLLNTYGQDVKGEIPENIWNMQKREGKIYSVPLLGMLYRKDYAVVSIKNYMDNYGNIDEIGKVNRANYYTNKECYEVFEKYLERIKAENKIGTGISCHTFSKIADKGYEGIYGPDSPFVIKIFDNDLKVYNKYELESYTLFFKTMSEWYQKGYIREDIEEILDPGSYDGKRNGNVLFLDEYGEHGVVTDMIATEYEAVREPLQDYKYISFESCRNAIAIPRTTNNPQRAMEIINLLNSKKGAELYRLLVNGFEGRHYVKKGNNQVDKITDETGKALYTLSQYAIGNVFYNYESSSQQFEQLKEYNSKAIVSPLLGFELDTRMIVIELAKIDLVVSEYIDKLSLGISNDWEETYNEFINKMKQAGSDKVISEIQKQITVFKE